MSEAPVVRNQPAKQPHEPILNIPPVVAAIIGALVLVHAARTLLTPLQDRELLLEFAFIPARYADTLAPIDEWPGGWGAAVWTFITHAFLHAGVLHLAVNIAWLLPFGTAIARRFGAVRFLVLFVVTAAAGAAAHLLTHWGEADIVVVVGASGAVSGIMAAAIRFVFQRGGPLHLWAQTSVEAYRIPAAPLTQSLRDARVLTFLVIWFAINLLPAVGAVSMPGVEGTIAWQAHFGGFLAGLLLFPLFDPVAGMHRVNGNGQPQSNPPDH